MPSCDHSPTTEVTGSARRHTTIERGANVAPVDEVLSATVETASTHGPSSWNVNDTGTHQKLHITYRPPETHANVRDSWPVSGDDWAP